MGKLPRTIHLESFLGSRSTFPKLWTLLLTLRQADAPLTRAHAEGSVSRHLSPTHKTVDAHHALYDLVETYRMRGQLVQEILEFAVVGVRSTT